MLQSVLFKLLPNSYPTCNCDRVDVAFVVRAAPFHCQAWADDIILNGSPGTSHVLHRWQSCGTKMANMWSGKPRGENHHLVCQVWNGQGMLLAGGRAIVREDYRRAVKMVQDFNVLLQSSSRKHCSTHFIISLAEAVERTHSEPGSGGGNWRGPL
ncbi:hypothetical protein DPEC_G00263540 [Dallia pectoralis]|uniref:Uncharacterized protein n=1 Tax=Dallia pectoralis TaxID=75939 RepID=A0ACC2FS61_DALPE|nr:hypothetical protein DPEC_G00263540 [Dallia pectoralis]